jgi:hypothetical protein
MKLHYSPACRSETVPVALREAGLADSLVQV